MDWQELKKNILVTDSLPERTKELLRLAAVRDGRQYDGIQYGFSTEYVAGNYIPLSQRRPSVQTNLCRVVVEDAAALLFGESHWPTIKAENEGTSTGLTSITSHAHIPSVMMEAVIKGSVGSVALLVEAVDNEIQISTLESAYLTPVWSASGRLESVTQQYQITGADVEAMGISSPPENRSVSYWYRREWTTTECRVYAPWLVSDTEHRPSVSADLTPAPHGLGFVPIVWVRNLAPPARVPDGECTFERAISTVIEGDYLLSQSGRGLKYCSDPKLVLKAGGGDPAGGEEAPASQGGAANAIVVPPDGDAKMLEINGNAASSVLEQWRELRAIVLEQLHGNRAHSDKISSGQSGRAMEMMCQSLVWLADRLRLCYGEGALLSLYRMICDFSIALDGGIKVGGESVVLDASGLALEWPPYFPPTDGELLQLAQGLVTAVHAGILSNETACSLFASKIGGADPATEWARVQEDLANANLQAARKRDADLAKGDRSAAAAGRTQTHQVTA